jgi:hypothetical protein
MNWQKIMSKEEPIKRILFRIVIDTNRFDRVTASQLARSIASHYSTDKAVGCEYTTLGDDRALMTIVDFYYVSDLSFFAKIFHHLRKFFTTILMYIDRDGVSLFSKSFILPRDVSLSFMSGASHGVDN